MSQNSLGTFSAIRLHRGLFGCDAMQFTLKMEAAWTPKHWYPTATPHVSQPRNSNFTDMKTSNLAFNKTIYFPTHILSYKFFFENEYSCCQAYVM